MKRLGVILGRTSGGLHGAALLLGVATLLSQLLGLIRDRLLAGTFGAGETLDLYYAAFRVPDFLFIAVGSLLAVTVLVPLLVDTLDDTKKAEKLLSSLLTVFTAILLVASVIAYFLMPLLARIIAPGFGPEESLSLVHLSRILLLSPFLLGLSNLFGSVTQAKEQFLLYSISPILYNVGIITGIVLLYPIFGITGLVYGVVFGATLHLALQVAGSFFLFKESGTYPRFTLRVDWTTIRLVLSRSIPRAMAMGANQLSLLVLIAYASHLVSGSIAVFNLSYNLESVPMALIGVSYSVAAFPTMVRHLTHGKDAFVLYMRNVFRHVLFLSIPIATLFVILREEIVRAILGSGKFTGESIEVASLLLAIFSIAVVFQNMVLMFDRSYYADGKTLVPVATNVLGAVVTIVSGYYFIWVAPLSRELPYVVLGLPLAFTIGVMANMLVEWLCYRKDFGRVLDQSVLRTLGESIMSAFCMGVTAVIVLSTISNSAHGQTSLQALTSGAIAGLAGIVVALAVLRALRSRELDTFISFLRKGKVTS